MLRAADMTAADRAHLVDLVAALEVLDTTTGAVLDDLGAPDAQHGQVERAGWAVRAAMINLHGEAVDEHHNDAGVHRP